MERLKYEQTNSGGIQAWSEKLRGRLSTEEIEFFDEFEKYKAEDEGATDRRAKNTLKSYLYDLRWQLISDKKLGLETAVNDTMPISTLLQSTQRRSSRRSWRVREEGEEFEAIANPITQKLYRIAKADKPTLKAGWGT